MKLEISSIIATSSALDSTDAIFLQEMIRQALTSNGKALSQPLGYFSEYIDWESTTTQTKQISTNPCHYQITITLQHHLPASEASRIKTTKDLKKHFHGLADDKKQKMQQLIFLSITQKSSEISAYFSEKSLYIMIHDDQDDFFTLPVCPVEIEVRKTVMSPFFIAGKNCTPLIADILKKVSEKLHASMPDALRLTLPKKKIHFNIVLGSLIFSGSGDTFYMQVVMKENTTKEPITFPSRFVTKTNDLEKQLSSSLTSFPADLFYEAIDELREEISASQATHHLQLYVTAKGRDPMIICADEIRAELEKRAANGDSSINQTQVVFVGQYQEVHQLYVNYTELSPHQMITTEPHTPSPSKKANPYLQALFTGTLFFPIFHYDEEELPRIRERRFYQENIKYNRIPCRFSLVLTHTCKPMSELTPVIKLNLLPPPNEGGDTLMSALFQHITATYLALLERPDVKDSDRLCLKIYHSKVLDNTDDQVIEILTQLLRDHKHPIAIHPQKVPQPAAAHP